MGVLIELVRDADLTLINPLRGQVNNSERCLQRPCSYILKASIDGKIIGTIGMEYHGNYALLRDLFVVKEYRRKGIGSALIKRCFEFCQKDGIRGIYLLTYFWNMKFFCPLGFELIRRRKGLPKEIENSWQLKSTEYNRCVCLGIRS